MRAYLDLLDHLLTNGNLREDRTGTGTIGCFGYQMRFDLQEGFPVLTTKKLHLRSIIHELLWFLQGDTNIQYLKDNGVRIWDEWADENGDLGPVYGYQWRSWPNPDGTHTDQIAKLVEQIKTNPYSRRHVISAWNPSFIDEMALPPCHCLFQFHVDNGRLNCQLYQRSADTFLGVPFNIASYALLTMMMAQVCDLEPGEFVHTFGDVHLYTNHVEQAREQLTREPRPLPQMWMNPDVKDLFAFTYDDFQVVELRSASAHQSGGFCLGPGDAHFHHCCRGQQRRHRTGQRPRVAPARRHEVLLRNDPGACGHYGPQELRIHPGEVSTASSPHEHRGDAQHCLRGARRAGCALAPGGIGCRGDGRCSGGVYHRRRRDLPPST